MKRYNPVSDFNRKTMLEHKSGAYVLFSAVQELLADVLALQPAMLEMITREGFVFRGDGGVWEKLAFTLYSEICGLDSRVRAIRDE